MLPPGMSAQQSAEDALRLQTFRQQQHRSMGWFYRLLDVPYGIQIAADDVARFTTAAAIGWALFFDALITLLFGLVWWRYDLMSTWTTLDPLATGLTKAANTLLGGLNLPEQFASFAGGLLAFLIRVVVTLGPSLIQFRMPYDASRHDAAWFALWATAVFDMGTDSVDVRTDVPQFFGWLITSAANADNAVWWSLIGLGLFLLVIRSGQWPVWVALIVMAVACMGWGQAGNIVFWANVGFWTIFASFAAQSLFFIYLAKTGMLVYRLRLARATVRA